jgi:hypothetical protein
MRCATESGLILSRLAESSVLWAWPARTLGKRQEGGPSPCARFPAPEAVGSRMESARTGIRRMNTGSTCVNASRPRKVGCLAASGVQGKREHYKSHVDDDARRLQSAEGVGLTRWARGAADGVACEKAYALESRMARAASTQRTRSEACSRNSRVLLRAHVQVAKAHQAACG